MFSISDTAFLLIVINVTFLTSLYLSSQITFLIKIGLFYECHFKMRTASHGAGSQSLVWRECKCGGSLLCVNTKLSRVTLQTACLFFSFWQMIKNTGRFFTDTHIYMRISHREQGQTHTHTHTDAQPQSTRVLHLITSGELHFRDM